VISVTFHLPGKPSYNKVAEIHFVCSGRRYVQKGQMMKKVSVIGLLVLAVAAVSVIAFVSAHEGRSVGDNVITFGWRVEPAYTELFNGPEIFIENHDTGEPVIGAEETLKLEVSLGSATKQLRLRAVFNEPGAYTADLIPTRAGDYTFRLTGKIGDTDVDESFSSADGEFSTVEPVDDIRFP
jgi:hypothetical protein